MRMVDLIHKKRDGGALTQEELRFLIQGYTIGDIPDYQMAAFAVAVFYRGMDRAGDSLFDRRHDAIRRPIRPEPIWNQHSGQALLPAGCGDKTTMIVAPIVASLGAKVAKMTGRGLGHTGGTADKLESIPGFHINLTPEQFLKQVQELGLAVIAQSGNLTPADKKLYALRDVTATVDSLPLITSSIMSKKLAAWVAQHCFRCQNRIRGLYENAAGGPGTGAEYGGHRQSLRPERGGGDDQYGHSAGNLHWKFS